MNRKALEEKMNILQPLMGGYIEFGFGGRPWGRGKTNPYRGSYFLMALEKNLVAVHINNQGKVEISEFRATSEKSAIGIKARQLLKKTGLKIAIHRRS